MNYGVAGDKLKVDTVEMQNGNAVSICHERGGIITSIRFGRTEILYLDKETLLDPAVNVRGGIPILFPNAGALQDGSMYPNIKQHGFARNSDAWDVEKMSNGFKETLIANEATLAIFPHDFRLTVTAQFETDGSFTLRQCVENMGGGDMPVAMGLHPYFKVPCDMKTEMRFNFVGGKAAESLVESWANGKYISIDNPKVKDASVVMEIEIPTIGTLAVDASPEYKKVWIWSMPEKDFVCIEPVMRDVNGLIDDPGLVKPNEIIDMSMNLKLIFISH